MSLIKQLWLAIIFIVTLATAGSFIFSTVSSKQYLEQQMQMKNIDNASSLALSISQMEKDPTTIELLMAAQFDAGHYKTVSLVDPNGKAINVLTNSNSKTNAPSWFTRLFPITVAPGIAEIQDGWQQFGTLTVKSDINFAYDQLWNSTIKIALWALALGLITCLIGSKLLKNILKPLDYVVDQAEAIGEHRFITINEPKTFEFKSVVRAMNKLSNRIKQTVLEESARLEALRFEINFEPITGLMNHDFFTNSINSSISHEEYFDEGVLVVARINNLATIDEHLGYHETNQLLKKFGNQLEKECANDKSMHTGRLNGSDFAVFSSYAKDPAILGNQINHLIKRLNRTDKSLIDIQFTTVATVVHKKDTAESIISLVQNIIQESSINIQDSLQVIGQSEIEGYKNKARVEWLPQLVSAIEEKRVKLEQYPVIDQKGDIIHYESPVRLQLEDNDRWFHAGEFISWASKLNLISKLDELVVETAINLLKNGAKPIGINISATAMANPDFVKSIVDQIKATPAIAKKLYFEVPEQGVFQQLDAFRLFCKQLKVLGCHVGIEHFGAKISSLGELHDLGLDYIKIDVSVIRKIDQNEANQTLLRGISMIAHSIGVIAIAEGVQNSLELETLKQIGVDGMTGPGVD